MENLYKGTGNIKDYEQSLDFLNWVFFSDDPEESETDFLSMLPKLYKKEYDHCSENQIVALNDKWQAAVGLYVDEMDICGEKILCGGIGNVAVGKNCRGKGYMKDCMRLAKEKCLKENVDFMILGGQRQRYGYFGFEPAGAEYEYCVNSTNIRHIYGKDYVSSLTAQAVSENDSEALDFIFELYNKTFRSRILRKREKLYDILVSWYQKPFVFKENGKYTGYALFSDKLGYVTESAAVNDEYFRLLIPALLKNSGKEAIHIKMPASKASCNQILTDVCEGFNFNHCDLVNILNWKRMVYALLKQKSEYKNFCDGKQTFLIHGDRADELFTVKIENNTVTVADGGENPFELSHKEAMQMFTGLYSGKRNELNSGISGWFPLDFSIFSADTV